MRKHVHRCRDCPARWDEDASPSRRLTPLRLCPVCFSDFVPETADHRYCSRACKERGLYRRSVGGWEADVDFVSQQGRRRVA